MVHQYTDSLNYYHNHQCDNKWQMLKLFSAMMWFQLSTRLWQWIKLLQWACGNLILGFCKVTIMTMSCGVKALPRIICSLTETQRILSKISFSWQSFQVVSLNQCCRDWIHLHHPVSYSTPNLPKLYTNTRPVPVDGHEPKGLNIFLWSWRWSLSLKLSLT